MVEADLVRCLMFSLTMKSERETTRVHRQRVHLSPHHQLIAVNLYIKFMGREKADLQGMVLGKSVPMCKAN